ncbi:MAG: hypothetical protein ACRDTE_30775 [Pseudonocardiaceae bacterium]
MQLGNGGVADHPAVAGEVLAAVRGGELLDDLDVGRADVAGAGRLACFPLVWAGIWVMDQLRTVYLPRRAPRHQRHRTIPDPLTETAGQRRKQGEQD